MTGRGRGFRGGLRRGVHGVGPQKRWRAAIAPGSAFGLAVRGIAAVAMRMTPSSAEFGGFCPTPLRTATDMHSGMGTRMTMEHERRTSTSMENGRRHGQWKILCRGGLALARPAGCLDPTPRPTRMVSERCWVSRVARRVRCSLRSASGRQARCGCGTRSWPSSAPSSLWRPPTPATARSSGRAGCCRATLGGPGRAPRCGRRVELEPLPRAQQ